ncbi:MAG: HAMP domain-containing histidine kinase [Pleurocapsa sp. SU_5_0]|nr:HAMP domain-containing histidine kinase [Pleurocapsa sp. SU_5_0]
MNLRKKLLTTFSALALLTLATASMTLWAIAKWQDSEQRLKAHYQRSLLLLGVQASTFRAIKELPDAIIGNDPDARQEFEDFLKPAEADFQLWTALADTEAEQQQVQQVRNGYETLIKDARITLDLIEQNRRDRAFRLLENQLEGKDFVRFQELTQQAVESDRQNRQIIQSQTQNTRQTAELVLVIVAFGSISLMLLLAAYLASDLFAPLREVEQALNDFAKGNWKTRLNQERTDEIGAINQAFNRMTEIIGDRDRLAGLTNLPDNTNNDGRGVDNSAWQNIPSRLTLHRLLSQLRSQVLQLNYDDGVSLREHKQQLVERLDSLLLAVRRITEFGFPLDLNLARTDIRSLIYEVIMRFQSELIERSISLDLNLSPEISYAVVDRLKLREVLSELIRNALSALPERGGCIGMRTNVSEDGSALLIEIADDGKGIEQPLVEKVFSSSNTLSDTNTGVGLTLTKAIVEQHGGKLLINSEPGKGTYVCIQIPF